jgi:hypothetical protein
MSDSWCGQVPPHASPRQLRHPPASASPRGLPRPAASAPTGYLTGPAGPTPISFANVCGPGRGRSGPWGEKRGTMRSSRNNPRVPHPHLPCARACRLIPAGRCRHPRRPAGTIPKTSKTLAAHCPCRVTPASAVPAGLPADTMWMLPSRSPGYVAGTSTPYQNGANRPRYPAGYGLARGKAPKTGRCFISRQLHGAPELSGSPDSPVPGVPPGPGVPRWAQTPQDTLVEPGRPDDGSRGALIGLRRWAADAHLASQTVVSQPDRR